MVQYQVDVFKRVAYPSNPDGYYYWSTVYYTTDTQFPDVDDIIYEASLAEEFGFRESVQFWGYVLKSPPGRGNIIAESYGGFDFGLIPDGSGEYTLHNVGRVWLWSVTGRLSWRFLRAPINDEDIVDGQLSGSIVGYLNNYCNAYVGSGLWTNSHGELLDRFELSPFVHGWQMRHGTKRRERVPGV